MHEQSPDLDPPLATEVARRPVGRRTILAGTAFAVPAVMLTTGTPAFAASGVSLAFDKSSYSGQGCSTISGAKVSATESGAAKAGVSVTASLSDGYSFSNGGTSYTGTTDSNGLLTLLDINVPQDGGDSTVTATASGASSTSASINGTATAGPAYVQNGTKKIATGVSAGATPMGGAIFLTSDGKVVDGANNGVVIASNVAAVGQEWVTTQDTWVFPLRKSDGTCTLAIHGDKEASTTGVPSGSTPAVGSLFLSSDYRLIQGKNGNVLATNVDSWGDIYFDGNVSFLPLKKRDGSFNYLQDDGEMGTSGVPAGSKPLGARFFFTTDGRVVEYDGTVWASNIDRYGQIGTYSGNNWNLPLRQSDGTCVILQGSKTLAQTTGVPSGSTPVANTLFLTSDHRLIDGANGNVLATHVDKTGSYYHPNDDSYWSIPVVLKCASAPVLAFDKSSYSGQGCSTITGVTVSASTDGAADSGVAITVTLADGYTFSTGGTSHTDTTGSGGSITLPDINVPEAGGNSTMKATASGHRSASASLAGSAAPEAIVLQNGKEATAANVGSGSTPMGGNLFLTSDKRVVDSQYKNGQVVSTDIAAFGQIYIDTADNWVIPMRKSNGTCVMGVKGSVEAATTGVPSGSTPALGSLFLTSDNRLVNGNNGAVLATRVDSWGYAYYDGTNRSIALKKTDGSTSYLSNNTERPTMGVPNGSTPAASANFLASDGRLIVGGDGRVLATNVAAFGAQASKTANTNDFTQPLRKKDGSCTILDAAGNESTATGVPNGSTPLARTLFLTSDKRIIDGSDGTVLATNITAEGTFYHPYDQAYWTMPLIRKGGC